jgi:glycosyltransferase involved in cell wall biosynthesis
MEAVDNDVEPGRPLHVLELLGNAIVGGMETCVIRLVRELPRESFRVTALCPFESPITDALRDAGCSVLIAPVRDDPAWQTVQMAATCVNDGHVDVIHAHLSNAHLLGALVSSLTQRPCVATIHGRAIPMLDLEAHRFCDRMHMSVVCRSAHSHARALGIANDRVTMIPNGVPAPDCNADRGLLAAELGVARDTPLVGFVGRLSPEKAPDAFVRAASLVAGANPAAGFVVIGDGPMRAELRRMADALGIGEHVHFIGERDDVQRLLPSLSILVVPSHTEGMPLALMEGMAAGVPVVATAVGGIPELLQHQRTGLLVAPGDVAQIAVDVAQLLRDAGRRAAMGALGRARASALWPQRESALQMGRLLQRVAHDHDAAVRQAREPRVKLAGRRLQGALGG